RELNEGIVEDTTKKNSNGGWLFETGKGDCTLKATGGYYTFTFNTVNHKVNIYYSVSDPYATEPPEVPTTENRQSPRRKSLPKNRLSLQRTSLPKSLQNP
ncbi:MAG: hypothetical protein IIU39_08450, partial [Ruminococcus sp.]|nr:hypothetical protein [Ruminococcus sp.]